MNCNCCWFIQPDTAISRNRNGSRDFVMRKVTLSPDHRQCTALSAIPCCLCRSIFRTLRHRLDWFHVWRRLEKIRKDILYLPVSDDDFDRRRALHGRNVDRVKWTLWNQGIAMADWGTKIFRAGLAEHAWDESKESLSRFQAVNRGWTSSAPTYIQIRVPYVAMRKLFDGRREYRQHTLNRQ
jgi:hypothetical protein